MNTDRCTSLSNSSFFFLKEQELILNEEKEIHLLHFASIIHKQSLNGIIICSALKRRVVYKIISIDLVNQRRIFTNTYKCIKLKKQNITQHVFVSFAELLVQNFKYGTAKV